MPALPEYRTRLLLEQEGVPLVPGTMIRTGDANPSEIAFPVFLKAQIPGATSRKSSGLVRRTGSASEFGSSLSALLEADRCEGVLVTRGVDIAEEIYAAVVFDGGSSLSLPGGRILFSRSGGSGIESRSGSLVEIPFQLSSPPSPESIAASLPEAGWTGAMAEVLSGMTGAFLKYRLLVIEANPVAILADGSVVVVDCRAEYEERAVRRGEEDLFGSGASGASDSVRIERIVDGINKADPAGTGFYRWNREDPPEGALRVATNLCGGGGKMLWEMAVGGRDDIFTINESDTSGGLSAFKSYRFLRAVLEQEDAEVLVFTGSGMAFQSQLHIAAALWKALRESPNVVPVMVRFGGTDEDRARALFARIADSLRVRVRTYPSEVFPNVMVDEMKAFVGSSGGSGGAPVPLPSGTPSFMVTVPPGEFFVDPGRCSSCQDRPCIGSCPAKFLHWVDGAGPSPLEGARCTGCLMCEASCLLDGNRGLSVRLSMPEVE